MGMAVPVLKQLVLFLFLFLLPLLVVAQATPSWCVARSDASYEALQTALDYACASGADCTPILSNGLCFLPNTIQAHASYAFNSYYQRRAMAPGSCDFAGTATVAKTDPSYGSCMYPSSQSTAGGIATPTIPTTGTVTGITNPNVPVPPTSTTPFNGDGSTGLNNPGLTPPMSTTDESDASLDYVATKSLMPLMLLLALSFILHPIRII